MINCLTDYIGLYGVKNAPASGRYVNDLQGIDTDQFELIKKEERYSVEEAWEIIEKRAIKKFESKINQWASRYYANYSYVDNVVTGQYDANTDADTSAQYAGWHFDNFASYWKNMKLVIPWVQLYAKSPAASFIWIFNATTGDLLDRIEHDFVTGINRVTINKEYPLYKYPNIFIAYRSDEVSTIKSDDLPFDSDLNLSQKAVSTASTPVESNLVANDNGLILSYNVDCSIENYVCQRLALFEEPYLYALGVEFCNERIYSDRISRFTLLDREDAVALRDELKMEFEEQLEGILKSLKMDTSDGYCFQCEGLVNRQVLLP